MLSIEHRSSQNANPYAATIISTDNIFTYHLMLGMLQRTEIRTAESAVGSREGATSHLEGIRYFVLTNSASL
jgi:hypothetical protein